MHTADNLPGYPWIWRRAGDNPAPLNADVRPTNAPNFGANNGTMHGLTSRADKLLALKADHRAFKIGTPNAVKSAQNKPADSPHGGAYSKVVPAHLSRPATAKPPKVAA